MIGGRVIKGRVRGGGELSRPLGALLLAAVHAAAQALLWCRARVLVVVVVLFEAVILFLNDE